MRRLMLLAVALSALLWTAAARPGSAPPDDIVRMSGAGPGQLAGDADTSSDSDSDRQWRSQQHTNAAVTESVWKSAPVHAALASSRSARTFDPIGAPSSPDPPVRSAPQYLRHTPLLI